MKPQAKRHKTEQRSQKRCHTDTKKYLQLDMEKDENQMQEDDLNRDTHREEAIDEEEEGICQAHKLIQIETSNGCRHATSGFHKEP